MSTDRFLTEQKLVAFCLKELDSSGICNKNFLTYKSRPDYFSHKLKLVVEFDGYLHYTKSSVVLSDIEKDRIVKQEGYLIVRIPYFVQLSAEIMRLLFGSLVAKPYDLLDYPHGFVDPTAVKPSDFCRLGVERYCYEIRTTFVSIRAEIEKGRN